jgi:hypothetical protein
MDLPGLVFIGAACFLIGIVFEDTLWDLRSVTDPYTEENSQAITAFYINATLGLRARAPYLLIPFPAGFVIVIVSLSYKLVHGMNVGDSHAVRTAAWSIGLLFPLIAIAAASTLPTIIKMVSARESLPLEERKRMHQRLFYQHVIYLILTVGAIVAHVMM